VLKQPLIRAQSTAGEPWRAVAQRVLGDALQDREQLVSSFDIAMTLVSAGYGLVVAPSARLAGYLNRGIAARPLAGAPDRTHGEVHPTCSQRVRGPRSTY